MLTEGLNHEMNWIAQWSIFALNHTNANTTFRKHHHKPKLNSWHRLPPPEAVALHRVLGLAGIDFISFTAACLVLWFGSVTKAVWTTQGGLSWGRTVKAFSGFPTEAEGAQEFGREQPGQLSLSDHRDMLSNKT